MSKHIVDLTGERIGTFTCIEPTGEPNPHDMSRMWRLRCVCGRTVRASVSLIRKYQFHDYGPRCTCPEYHAERKTRVKAPRARRCSGCGDVGHDYSHCPSRRPARICWRCCSLPWRVRGIKCDTCGLRFEREAPVELDVNGIQSSMALAAEHAPGNFL